MRSSNIPTKAIATIVKIMPTMIYDGSSVVGSGDSVGAGNGELVGVGNGDSVGAGVDIGG